PHDAAEPQEQQAVGLHERQEGLGRGGGHEAEFPPDHVHRLRPPRDSSHARACDACVSHRRARPCILPCRATSRHRNESVHPAGSSSHFTVAPLRVRLRRPAKSRMAVWWLFCCHVSRRSGEGKAVWQRSRISPTAALYTGAATLRRRCSAVWAL